MKVKKDYIDFKKEIELRGIENLIHFTPTINLYSILEQGSIMSRKMLENLDISQFDILDYVQFSDKIRYDDKNYINLSISRPNTFLLNRFIEKTKDDPTINWCIIKIDPKHIYDQDTLFSVTNAASRAAKQDFGITGDLNQFRKLFSNNLTIQSSSSIRKYDRENLAAKYPTDSQAEVLVKDFIPYSSIISICFQSDSSFAEAKAAMEEFDTTKFRKDSEIFNGIRL